MEERTSRYSIIIPVYNESQNLNFLYQRIKKTMFPLSEDYEVIFIDDGSTDYSYEILREMSLDDIRIKVISLSCNCGQHPAIIAGFKEARGAFLITLDADLQDIPEEIPRLINKIKEGYKMVAGQRINREENIIRCIGSYIANLIISILVGKRIRDYACMLRIYSNDLAKKLISEYEKQPLFIPILIHKITKDVAEINVRQGNRLEGKSKYNYSKLAKGFFLTIIRYYPRLSDFLQKIGLGRRPSQLYIIKKRIEYGKESILACIK